MSASGHPRIRGTARGRLSYGWLTQGLQAKTLKPSDQRARGARAIH